MGSAQPEIEKDPLLNEKYPAKAHTKKVAAYLVEHEQLPKDGVIYLESAHTRMIEDNDEPVPFRQRRYFYYFSGCDLPDSYLTYNIPQDILTLFIPPIDPDSVVWAGLPLSPEEALKKYDIDQCLTSDQLNAALTAHSLTKSTVVYAIPDQVSDHVTFLGFASADWAKLKTAIEMCRVVKDDYEVAMIRHANKISTLAHNALVEHLRSGTATNERHLWATFISTCMAHGGTQQAYHAIVASGTAAATLHYTPNDAPLRPNKLNLLVDAGCEYNTYCADITRVVPIKEEFSKESQAIYDIVLRMQTKCMAMIHAGVEWESVHTRAHEVAIDGLLDLGILRDPNSNSTTSTITSPSPTTRSTLASTILTKRISCAFFPHGLGHYLGMDTHDCGGNPDYADPDPMFKYLRVRGRLPRGSVITVEPGIYFCRFIIEPLLRDKEGEGLGRYVDEEVLERYWDVGGVRIEDDVLVVEEGEGDIIGEGKGGCVDLTDTPKLG